MEKKKALIILLIGVIITFHWGCNLKNEHKNHNDLDSLDVLENQPSNEGKNLIENHGEKDTVELFLIREGFIKAINPITYFGIWPLWVDVDGVDRKYANSAIRKWLPPTSKNILYVWQYWIDNNYYFLLTHGMRNEFQLEFLLTIYDYSENEFKVTEFKLCENDEEEKRTIASIISDDKIFRYHFQFFDKSSKEKWAVVSYYSEVFLVDSDKSIKLLDKSNQFTDTFYVASAWKDSELMEELFNKPNLSRNVFLP